MPPDIADADLEPLDREVNAAIASGKATGLKVLGHGEITLVLGWPAEAPRLALKRLPVLRDRAAFERYRDLLARYVAALEARGVGVLPSDVRGVPAAGGTFHGYVVQPLVPAGELLTSVLRRGDERGEALLGRIAGHVADAVDASVGLDAQPSNWAVDGERLANFDVTTPMLRTDAGRDEIDFALFLSIYPWMLRGGLRPVARSILRSYHDPRAMLVDVGSNLVKERLDRWLGVWLEAANARTDPPITPAEVRRYFARDVRLWNLMQRLRRADRAWQRRVRRREYPFLLPPPYRYENVAPPESEPT